MRVAVIGEPGGWHVRRVGERLARRGHEPVVVRWAELGAAVETGGERFLPAALEAAAVALVRGMPGGVMDGDRLERVIARMDMLARLAARGVPVVNHPRALEAAIDKYLAAARLAAAGLPVPRCRIAQGPEAAVAAWHQLGGDCVLKPLFGSRGRGLARVRDPRDLGPVETGAAEPERVYLLQEFVDHGGWDARILTVGDRVFAMRRRAAAGDWRTNVSRGGAAEPFAPPTAWVDVALAAARCLETEVAGVDIAPAADGGPLVLEVNGVPGWRGLEAATGADVTGAVVDYALSKARSR